MFDIKKICFFNKYDVIFRVKKIILNANYITWIRTEKKTKLIIYPSNWQDENDENLCGIDL